MRLDKQQSVDGSTVLDSQQPAACAAPVQRSTTLGQEDYAEPTEKLATPRFEKMASAAPILIGSGKKNQLLTKYKTDIN